MRSFPLFAPRFALAAFATCVLFASAGSAGATGYSTAILADAPVVYYPMDEAAGSTTAVNAGSAGSGFDTNQVNTVTFGGAGAGPSTGTSVDLSSTGYFDIPGTSNHYSSYLNAGPATLEYWVKTTQNDSGGNSGWNNPALIGEDNSTSCCGTTSGSGTDLWWGVMEGGNVGVNTGNNPITVQVSAPINDGNWHHIVMTRTSGGAITIYVDGVSSATGSIGATRYTYDKLGIGSSNQLSNAHLDAAIDEVAIYDKVLTPAQVAAHFAAASFPPVVSNSPATAITSSSAQLNGEVIDVGDGQPSVTIRWGDEDGGSDAGSWDEAEVLAGTQPLGPFSATTSTALSPNTTYYFRAFASNGAGDSSASPSLSFTTPAAAPAVANLAAADITAFTATLGADVTDTGGEDPTVTIYYGTSDGMTNAGSWGASISLGTPSGQADSGISGLTPNTMYYFRAFASNSGGSAWAGASGTFTTTALNLPGVTNSPATNITGITANLNGAVTSTGGDAPDITFYYGTSDGGSVKGSWGASVAIGERTGSFSRQVINLLPETTYYFRALATNAAGEVWASPSLSFTTPVYVPPSVVINEIHYDEDDKTVRAEFIELFNPTAGAVDLTGFYFSSGIDFVFPPGATLPAGGFVVIAEDVATMSSEFGVSGSNVYGPFANGTVLKNSGETVRLRDPAGTTIDEVDYQLGFPWPTVGDEVGSPLASPSIQLIEPLMDNDLGGSWRSEAPTPAAQNSNYSTTAPPQVRQVEHNPVGRVLGQDKTIQPAEDVLVTAKATDPDGVASMTLQYQIVEPGDYIQYDDARYPTQWTNVAMVDDGTGGDALAADDVYTVTLPGSMQTHRRLIRYRIIATDTGSASITLPYPDDVGRNFAYFVYGGLPDWTAGATTYDFSQLEPVPVYHLITTRTDHEQAQWIPNATGSSYGGSNYNWFGALVYDGKVYDHIHYRARGGVWRYSMGKNMWKFDFNRGRRFQARDDYGEKYDTTWDKLNFSALIQQGNFGQRGEQGLFEGAGFKLHNLLGNPAPKTNYVHFRIIEHASENGPTGSQFDDDFQGLYLAIEQPDGQLLDEHDLPDGNLYKMEGGSGSLNNQGPSQPSNKADLNAFLGAFDGGATASQSWWEDNLWLDDYYNFYAAITAIHDNDIHANKNYFFYHRPVDPADPQSDKWQVINWDLDLCWTTTYRLNSAPNDRLDQDVFAIADFARDYRNRMREVRDLLFNAEQTGLLLDEIAQFVHTPGQPSFVDADKDMWDTNPILVSGYINSSKAGHNKYWEAVSPRSFANMVQHLKDYVGTRSTYIDNDVLTDDAQVPDKPTITYSGVAGYPANGLQFDSSAYSSPVSSPVASTQWRVAEITPPAMLNKIEPPKYEIQADWTSAEQSGFTASQTFPATVTRAGSIYRARVRHEDAAGRWSHWSDPVEFTATAPDVTVWQDNLMITEIMYHPTDATPVEIAAGWSTSDFEYLELQNVSTVLTLDLSDLRFTKGVDFDFIDGSITSLAPGERVLVVRNQAAFESRHGTGLPVAGEWEAGDKLDNGGENLKLSFGAGVAVHEFEYDDGGDWPESPDGDGPSLVLIAPDATPRPDHADPFSWRPSTTAGGNPGATDAVAFAGDPAADDDGDSLDKFMEHALGTSDADPDPNDAPVVGTRIFDDGMGTPREYLTITYRRNLGADDAVYEVQTSTTLAGGSWGSGAGITEFVSMVDHGDGTASMTWRSATPISDLVREFIRLVVMSR